MTGRAAVVTGAAQGIGAAIARRLASDGYAVALLDVNVAGAQDIAAELGEPAVALEADVSDEASFAAGFDAAVGRFGGVDVLVNNAALTIVRSPWEIEAEEWDRVLAVNLRGVFNGCRLAGRHMRERGHGRIVNLASVAGQNSRAVTGLHYSSSKAGIVNVTRHMATELAPHGVTVNAVAPAAIDGPMVASVAPERIQAMLETIPVGRLGRPEEVAAVVAFLASDEAGFVTGATIDVNGGMLMR